MVLPKIEIPVLKKCTLQEAIDWLAFDIKPIASRYKAKTEKPKAESESKMQEAEQTLIVLLSEGSVKVTGIRDADCIIKSNGSYQVFRKINKSINKRYNRDGENEIDINHDKAADLREVVIFEDGYKLFIDNNCIGYKEAVLRYPEVIDGYRNIEIDFEELENINNKSLTVDLIASDRKKLIIRTAKTLSANITERPSAIRAIQDKLGKSNNDKGYNYNTISGIIKDLKNSDGSLRFSKALQGNFRA